MRARSETRGPRTIVVFIAAAFVLLAGPAAGDAVASCSAPVKSTAYDDPATADTAAFVQASQWLAQSFTVPTPVPLNKITLDLQNQGGTADSITVQVRSDAMGEPGTVLGTRTRTLSNTTLEFADFDFSSDNLTLTAGTTYHIAATNTSGSSDGYAWAEDLTNATYPGGNMFVSPNSGTSWNPLASNDLLFQVWGQTCTADAQPIATTPAPDKVAPTIFGFALDSTTIRAADKGDSVASRARIGTEVFYRLSEAATSTFTLEREVKGRKKGRKCVTPNSRNRRAKRCTSYRRLRGSFARSSTANLNSFRFTGRLRGKSLRGGRYRLVMVATDAAGNRSKPKRAKFQVVLH